MLSLRGRLIKFLLTAEGWQMIPFPMESGSKS